MSSFRATIPLTPPRLDGLVYGDGKTHPLGLIAHDLERILVGEKAITPNRNAYQILLRLTSARNSANPLRTLREGDEALWQCVTPMNWFVGSTDFLVRDPIPFFLQDCCQVPVGG